MYHFATDNYSILKAKVNPGQRAAESNHDAWVVLNRDTGSLKLDTAHAWLSRLLYHVDYCLCLLLAVWVKFVAI